MGDDVGLDLDGYGGVVGVGREDVECVARACRGVWVKWGGYPFVVGVEWSDIHPKG